MGIAGGAAEAQHRVGLVRLEHSTANEFGVFVGLKVRQSNDNWLRIESGGNRAYTFGQVPDEILARRGKATGTIGNALPVGDKYALRMHQRHWMHPDMLTDDELHAREP